MAFKLTNAPFPKRKDKKKKSTTSVDFSTETPESLSTTGTSMSSETAKKMWRNSASPEEMSLGHKLTQDSEGNFIARTKLSSKA